MNYSLNLGYQISTWNTHVCVHTYFYFIHLYLSFSKIPSFRLANDLGLIPYRSLIQFPFLGNHHSAGWFSLLTGFNLIIFSHFWLRGSVWNCFLQSCGINAQDFLLKIHFTSIRQISIISQSIVWSLQVIIFTFCIFSDVVLSKDIHRWTYRCTYGKYFLRNVL